MVALSPLREPGFEAKTKSSSSFFDSLKSSFLAKKSQEYSWKTMAIVAMTTSLLTAEAWNTKYQTVASAAENTSSKTFVLKKGNEVTREDLLWAWISSDFINLYEKEKAKVDEWIAEWKISPDFRYHLEILQFPKWRQILDTTINKLSKQKVKTFEEVTWEKILTGDNWSAVWSNLYNSDDFGDWREWNATLLKKYAAGYEKMKNKFINDVPNLIRKHLWEQWFQERITLFNDLISRIPKHIQCKWAFLIVWDAVFSAGVTWEEKVLNTNDMLNKLNVVLNSPRLEWTTFVTLYEWAEPQVAVKRMVQNLSNPWQNDSRFWKFWLTNTKFIRSRFYNKTKIPRWIGYFSSRRTQFKFCY